MALTGANDQIETALAGTEVVEHIIKDTVQIFFGALVAIEEASGEVVNPSDITGLIVLGLAVQSEESLTGNSSTPRVKIKVDQSGLVIRGAAVTGAVQASESDLVFATDENTFTMTPGSNLAAIGTLQKFISAAVGDVKLFTPQLNRKT